jgi:hypothetical protein
MERGVFIMATRDVPVCSGYDKNNLSNIHIEKMGEHLNFNYFLSIFGKI